jgi:hypothetical protein
LVNPIKIFLYKYQNPQIISKMGVYYKIII